ncbi:MAG: hypothetical protein ABJP33_15260 [Pseudoruegeria sp.]
MSGTLKVILTLGIAAFVSACGSSEEEVIYVDPVPVVEESTYTKY